MAKAQTQRLTALLNAPSARAVPSRDGKEPASPFLSYFLSFGSCIFKDQETLRHTMGPLESHCTGLVDDQGSEKP